MWFFTSFTFQMNSFSLYKHTVKVFKKFFVFNSFLLTLTSFLFIFKSPSKSKGLFLVKIILFFFFLLLCSPIASKQSP